jgi:hypothetical protein
VQVQMNKVGVRHSATLRQFNQPPQGANAAAADSEPQSVCRATIGARRTAVETIAGNEMLPGAYFGKKSLTTSATLWICASVISG